MTQSEAATDPSLLFIYGTLKRGHCRGPMMAGQRFLETVRTEPLYRLLHCGSYPGLVLAETGCGIAVQGELWEVDRTCLTLLDKEEGVDVGLYRRAAVDLTGPTPHAEGYLYVRDTALLTECGDCWTLELERRALGG